MTFAQFMTRLAQVSVDHAEELDRVFKKLEGSIPGQPDPLYLEANERFKLVWGLADSLGLSRLELLLLFRAYHTYKEDQNV